MVEWEKDAGDDGVYLKGGITRASRSMAIHVYGLLSFKLSTLLARFNGGVGDSEEVISNEGVGHRFQTPLRAKTNAGLPLSSIFAGKNQGMKRVKLERKNFSYHSTLAEWPRENRSNEFEDTRQRE